MQISKRILQALSVLGSDETVGGTLREQAEAYFGAEVDDRSILYCVTAAEAMFDHIMDAFDGKADPELVQRAALGAVMIGGMAVGKRLGIEDGENFARLVK